MIRVLVVHKVRLTCDLTAAALSGESDMRVVDCAQTAEEALAKIDRHAFDVALVNVNLPDNGALRFTRAITRGGKHVKTLITGLLPSKAAVLRYVEEGAAGYVFEDDSLNDLVRKIRRIHANEFNVSPNIGGALIARLAELKRQVTTIRTLAAAESFNEPAELTPREWEILHLIEQGMSNQEIARTLVIEMGTVKNHVHNILRKLDVQSRKHAVIFARQLSAQRGARVDGKSEHRLQPALAHSGIAATQNQAFAKAL
jgi:DNA-binding NarL/FixJ family response regulator